MPVFRLAPLSPIREAYDVEDLNRLITDLNAHLDAIWGLLGELDQRLTTRESGG